ncbi:sigma-70 family RNA polymerase sigma factor [Desulfotalea psychrophila]|uniref:Related to RNA polymerase sigma factor for flagellar operon n=1 Tax=Desulfotalea psychrophila (strain LSv54 / DSM 12343) TaxID=177439 RepID=Q6ANY1_DESPS|nr:sigma-70 family RNA polymerase sigma factor [Desulfotalea psychrophila]CAG35943.1 related to RNA polymerase sigma factor for flagellar operon [Desulfotalea psychrophila LSv54]
MEKKDQDMIVGVARKLYHNYVAGSASEVGISVEDLIQTGIIGYLEAKSRLDKEKGDGKAFIFMRMKGNQLSLIRRQALVRMPQKTYAKVKELLAVRKQLEASCVEATDQLLAERLGWTVKEIHQLLASVPRVFSSDDVTDNEESSDFYESHFLPGQNPQPLISEMEKKEIADLIQGCLARLENPRQRLILVAKYFEGINVKKLADRFGCSRYFVESEEQKGLGQMQTCLEKSGWQWDGAEID